MEVPRLSRLWKLRKTKKRKICAVMEEDEKSREVRAGKELLHAVAS